jgi:molecular chaperone GrpE
MTDELRDDQGLTPETAADIAEGTIEAGPALPLEVELAEMHAELLRCQHELAESKDAFLRAHADFDNYRKRLRATSDQEFTRGSERVLADLLAIVDDFERALASVTDQSTVDSLTQGVTLIMRQLNALLERYGITPMTVDGHPFDPKYHDAVASIPTTDVPEHTILGVIQKGYHKGTDVFRPAKVAVAVTPEE